MQNCFWHFTGRSRLLSTANAWSLSIALMTNYLRRSWALDNPHHVLRSALPTETTSTYGLRRTRHNRELINKSCHLLQFNFIVWMLYKDILLTIILPASISIICYCQCDFDIRFLVLVYNLYYFMCITSNLLCMFKLRFVSLWLNEFNMMMMIIIIIKCLTFTKYNITIKLSFLAIFCNSVCR